MRALGLLEEHELWALASEKVYSMFQKAYLENYRLDAAVSGYEWWLGFDWIAASNGIIGGNANSPRSKPGISNTTLQNLQANVMLLVKTPVALQSKGHRPGDFVPFEIMLATGQSSRGGTARTHSCHGQGCCAGPHSVTGICQRCNCSARGDRASRCLRRRRA